LPQLATACHEVSTGSRGTPATTPLVRTNGPVEPSWHGPGETDGVFVPGPEPGEPALEDTPEVEAGFKACPRGRTSTGPGARQGSAARRCSVEEG